MVTNFQNKGQRHIRVWGHLPPGNVLNFSPLSLLFWVCLWFWQIQQISVKLWKPVWICAWFVPCREKYMFWFLYKFTVKNSLLSDITWLRSSCMPRKYQVTAGYKTISMSTLEDLWKQLFGLRLVVVAHKIHIIQHYFYFQLNLTKLYYIQDYFCIACVQSVERIN